MRVATSEMMAGTDCGETRRPGLRRVPGHETNAGARIAGWVKVAGGYVPQARRPAPARTAGRADNGEGSIGWRGCQHVQLHTVAVHSAMESIGNLHRPGATRATDPRKQKPQPGLELELEWA